MNSTPENTPPHQHGEHRPDLSSTHSTHVQADLAMAGRCGNVHLPTGRICTLPERHHGSCEFVGPEEAEKIAPH